MTQSIPFCLPEFLVRDAVVHTQDFLWLLVDQSYPKDPMEVLVIDAMSEVGTWQIHYMENSSVGNWVKNSGLAESVQKEILNLHRNAPKKIREVYRMRPDEEGCIIISKSVIIVGEKNNTI